MFVLFCFCFLFFFVCLFCCFFGGGFVVVVLFFFVVFFFVFFFFFFFFFVLFALRKRLRIRSVISVNYHYITVVCPFNIFIRFECYNTV